MQGARHTFAEAMGKNVANPTAMLLCSANMLKHAGLDEYSELIKGAVFRVIKAGKVSDNSSHALIACIATPLVDMHGRYMRWVSGSAIIFRCCGSNRWENTFSKY